MKMIYKIMDYIMWKIEYYPKKSIKIGDKCIYCFNDTKFRSGRFVDRIPAENDYFDGYSCSECQYIPDDFYCDDCQN